MTSAHQGLDGIGRGRARVGCSGWSYDDWRGYVYPDGLPRRRWFEYYASLFDTVELNSTFYRLPTPEMASKWGSQAPKDLSTPQARPVRQSSQEAPRRRDLAPKSRRTRRAAWRCARAHAGPASARMATGRRPARSVPLRGTPLDALGGRVA